MAVSGELLALLDGGERSRAAAFHQTAARDAWIAARARLRTLVGCRLGCPPQEVAFALGEYGKPRVVRPETDLEFSLSHSGGSTLIALSGAGPVGVDLEPLHRGDELVSCVGQFCSDSERSHLPPSSTADLLRIWCAKEAYLKAIGTGFSVAPESLTVGWDDDGRASLRDDTGEEAPFLVHFLPVPGAPGWCAAVALRQGIACPPVLRCGSGE